MDMHTAVGGKAGLTEIQIAVAMRWEDADQLTPREQAALAFADGVSATPVVVSDELFDTLRGLFDEREIVELTSYIAHENYNAKMNRPLRVPANDLCEGVSSSRPLLDSAV